MSGLDLPGEDRVRGRASEDVMPQSVGRPGRTELGKAVCVKSFHRVPMVVHFGPPVVKEPG